MIESDAKIICKLTCGAPNLAQLCDPQYMSPTGLWDVVMETRYQGSLCILPPKIHTKQQNYIHTKSTTQSWV